MYEGGIEPPTRETAPCMLPLSYEELVNGHGFWTFKLFPTEARTAKIQKNGTKVGFEPEVL